MHMSSKKRDSHRDTIGKLLAFRSGHADQAVDSLAFSL